jgi:hypothetical protein
MKNKKRLLTLIFAVILGFAPHTAMATTEKEKKMLNQLDQLDRLDHMDFLEYKGKADACIRARDFRCADKNISKASKSAGNSQDKRELASLKQRLVLEHRFVQDEYDAEIRRQEAEERREDERKRAERAAEAEEARRESARSNDQMLAQFKQNLNDFSAQTAATNRETQRLYNNAVKENQAQADAREAERAERAEQARRAQNERAAENRRIIQENERIRQAQIASQQNQASQAPTPQEQQRTRKELQAQLNANEKQRNLRDQQLQQQANQDARANAQRIRQGGNVVSNNSSIDTSSSGNASGGAGKEADLIAEKRAKEQYLNSMSAGIRLKAVKCFGGGGKYYVVGSSPKIKPVLVECVDVRFRAYCPGGQGSEGKITAFLGIPSCLMGDSVEISPQPACEVEKVRVDLVDLTGCK